MKNYRIHKKSREKGFTLLFAVLMTSILLAIAFSIISLSAKHLIISSVGRESQVAFYSADSGLECVRYWDHYSRNAFSTSSPAATINCFGEDITVTELAPATCEDSTGDCKNFKVNFSLARNTPGAPDGDVYVEKNIDTNETSIDSYGHNTETASLRRVERAVKLTYIPNSCDPNLFIGIGSPEVNPDRNDIGTGFDLNPSIWLWSVLDSYFTDTVTQSWVNDPVNQSNSKYWFSDGEETSTISFHFVAPQGIAHNKYGYYLDENPSTYVELGDNRSSANPDQTFQFLPGQRVYFYNESEYEGETRFYSTDNSKNHVWRGQLLMTNGQAMDFNQGVSFESDQTHFVTYYNPITNRYYIGVEDLPSPENFPGYYGWDKNFSDTVFEINLAGC